MSTTGPESIKKFSSVDVCRIIKACKDAGIHSLEVQGLKVTFYCSERLGIASGEVVYDNIKQDKVVDNQVEDIEKEERMAKKERLQNMIIDDPMQYEDLLAAEELEDAR